MVSSKSARLVTAFVSGRFTSIPTTTTRSSSRSRTSRIRIRDRLLIPQVLIFVVQEKWGEGVWTSENLILEENLRKLTGGGGSRNKLT